MSLRTERFLNRHRLLASRPETASRRGPNRRRAYPSRVMGGLRACMFHTGRLSARMAVGKLLRNWD